MFYIGSYTAPDIHNIAYPCMRNIGYPCIPNIGMDPGSIPLLDIHRGRRCGKLPEELPLLRSPRLDFADLF